MKLDPCRLERFFARHEFSVPYLMCPSDCETMEIGDLLDLDGPGTRDRFLSLSLGYTDSLGGADLREAIASLYEHVPPERILVHAGAQEGIFNFMNVALNPGDGIVVQTPCYQSLAEVARGIGAEVVEWRISPDLGWEPDLDVLKGLITNRVKLVVVNFPHNPTGFLPGPDFVRELGALSERHGFLIFSDEVYRGLELDASDRLPAFADVSDRAVSLGVMSKAYGLAGLRIGWIAARDERLFGELAAFKDYTTICSSAPSEFLAALALGHGQRIIERNMAIIRDNIERLDRFFTSHKELFDWCRPKAGSVAFPGLKKGNAEKFCGDLLETKGVLLAPGTLFGPGYNAFRVGFGRRNLPEALERLEEYVREKY